MSDRWRCGFQLNVNKTQKVVIGDYDQGRFQPKKNVGRPIPFSGIWRVFFFLLIFSSKVQVKRARYHSFVKILR
jgi:hypothetical protein